ncbi:MAG: GGDEF domain-containing protein [Myxococcales bacterium]|nr:GGDEF domain-containing protein [Myxococcales bacterium]
METARCAHLIVLSGTNVGQVYRLEADEVTIGREDGSTIQLMDAGISRRHARLRKDGEGGYLLEDAGSRNGTFANNRRVERRHTLEDGDKIQVGVMTILKFSYDDELEADYARKMYDAALRDGLTGVFNRRYFDDRLASELAFSSRHNKALALLLIDLDHFKSVNDTHGHPAGDKILIGFGKLLQSIIRAEDVLARYGGEEFVILCRDTDVMKASILAERIRHAAASHYYHVESARLQVTVSIGVVAVPDQGIDSPAEMVDAADGALYQAKSKGRNCVITRRPRS